MTEKKKVPQELLYTIGHSTHPIDEFVNLLKIYGIKQLIDVRTIARSRHNPQFNEKRLATRLKKSKIQYSHDRELGGLRHATKDSINMGWRNASFRGYADYMQTDEFASALKDLMAKAIKKPSVIMCAEALPWRCHRSMIADAMVKQKWEVRHIMSKTSAYEHKLTPFAKMRKGKLAYPAIKLIAEPDKPMTHTLTLGSCVKIPDGRIGRVRSKSKGVFEIRVRRKTSNSHQFLSFSAKDIHVVPCPKGWMSPEGYNSYLRKTLAKMRQREKAKK
jgi:hypothetical protein